MKFGKSIKNQWNLSPDITFLNNGSFGATPLCVLEKQSQYQLLMEQNPVEFVIEKSANLLNESILAISSLIKANPENITFVENATTGVNSVLHYLIFQKKFSGEIIYTNQTYPAVVNTLKYYEQYSDITLNCINIPFPADENLIIEIFEGSITSKTGIVLIDTISSSTSTVFPFNELSELFNSKGIITIVDGAHGIGCLELDLSNPCYDFMTSNNHKWLFSPKGSAFLYANSKYIQDFHPLSISLFWGMGFRREFEWQGTKDLSSWIATKDAIDFYNNYGGNEIIAYNNNLITEARRIIKSEFDTVTSGNDNTACLSTFLLSDRITITPDVTLRLRKHFMENFGIEMPFMAFDSKIWFRITSQIYNDISDYLVLVEALKIFYSKGLYEFVS